MAMFFMNPFAVAGDRITIPQPEQGDGSVSYTQGFGPDYDRNLATDPDAIPVPRDQTNELYYQICLAIQQYQTLAVPDFITSSDNGGSPYSYAINAKARYDDGVNGPLIWQSLVNSNTQTPGFTSSQWKNVDNGISQAVGGDHSVFAGDVTNGAAVYYDASNSWYDLAIADGSVKQQMIGFANTATNFVVSNGFLNYAPGGLTPGSAYYLSTTVAGAITNVKPDNNIILVGIAITATLLAVSIDNSAILISSTVPPGVILEFGGTSLPAGFLGCDGSAVSRTTYAQLFANIGTLWGDGDGSTTFNLPDFRRRTAIGSGGTGSATIGNAVGDTGGEENHSLTFDENGPHNHTTDVPASDDGEQASGSGTAITIPTISSWASSISGSGTPHNTMQPSAVVLKMIKY